MNSISDVFTSVQLAAFILSQPIATIGTGSELIRVAENSQLYNEIQGVAQNTIHINLAGSHVGRYWEM